MFFLSLKIEFVLANSADPDELSYGAAFHLGLHCLPKYSFKGFFWNNSSSVGAQWLSGRVLDSRSRGCGFEPQQRHCIVGP